MTDLKRLLDRAMVVDWLPDGETQFRDHQGRLVGRIVNIGTAPADRPLVSLRGPGGCPVRYPGRDPSPSDRS